MRSDQSKFAVNTKLRLDVENKATIDLRDEAIEVGVGGALDV